MMAAIYATLLIAFILDLLGHQRFAVPCLFISLALCVLLFLWEIYSPVYGFRCRLHLLSQFPLRHRAMRN